MNQAKDQITSSLDVTEGLESISDYIPNAQYLAALFGPLLAVKTFPKYHGQAYTQ